MTPHRLAKQQHKHTRKSFWGTKSERSIAVLLKAHANERSYRYLLPPPTRRAPARRRRFRVRFLPIADIANHGALLPSTEKSRPTTPPSPLPLRAARVRVTPVRRVPARLLPPISIAQYRRPLAETAVATAWHPPSIMFARCGGDCIHIRLAQASVSHPIATFSATAPAGPRRAMKPA